MHEKNIALLCDEADRLLQLNINLLRQMVESQMCYLTVRTKTDCFLINRKH